MSPRVELSIVLGVYGLIDKFPLGVISMKGLTLRTAQQPGQRYMPRNCSTTC